MSLQAVLELVQELPLSARIRGEIPGTEWLFPAIETVHVLALTLVFGSISMVDLRLLGWTTRGRSVGSMMREALPWTWGAWGCAFVTGTLLFMSKASTYAYNTQFQMKLVAMFLAAINMLVFHFGVYRTLAKWDAAQTPPARAVMAGAVSLCCWVAVVFCGRWVGFTT